MSVCNFVEHWTIRGRVIAYFRFSKWRVSAILDLHIFIIFVKKSNLCLFLRRHANLVKVGRSAAELLRIFDFQYGGRLPT